MRTRLFLTILFSAAIFAGIACAAAHKQPPYSQERPPYPDALPKNFEKAPVFVECKADIMPTTGIHGRHYAHPQEKWIVGIAGRNKKDEFLLFIKQTEAGEHATLYVLVNGKWEEGVPLLITPEEGEFLNECSNQTREKANIPHQK